VGFSGEAKQGGGEAGEAGYSNHSSAIEPGQNETAGRLPHAGGTRGKKRPAVIVQADVDNGELKHFVVAAITKTLAPASDPASSPID
jgi:hypothetical protein